MKKNQNGHHFDFRTGKCACGLTRKQFDDAAIEPKCPGPKNGDDVRVFEIPDD